MLTTASESRVVILGNGGSGKTSLATFLHQQWNIPVLHLDKIYWQSGWQHANLNLFDEKVSEFLLQPNWVIEGTPMRGLKERLTRANLIIFLDLSSTICCYRLLKRAVTYTHAVEDGCPAPGFSLKALKWVLQFPYKQRKQIAELLSNFPNKKIIHITQKKSLHHLLHIIQNHNQP